MAIKAVYPKKTVQKRKSKTAQSVDERLASTKKSSSRSLAMQTKKGTARLKTAAARSRSAKKGRTPIKKSTGFIQSIFSSNRKAGEMDYTFLLLVGVLVVFGLIMLLSASTPTADVKFGRSYHFFLRQLLYVAAGTGAMMVLANIDYRKLKPLAKPFMFICIGMLVLVFLPGIGVSHNGSRRWINLGITEIQPSEFAKLAVAMFFATIVEDKLYRLDTINGLAKYGVWILIVAALMLAETHLSGTIVLCGIAICVLLVGGANAKVIFTTGGIAAAVGGLLIHAIDPVRTARFTSFLNPFADKQGSGYQTIQSLYAIGSGGMFGKGLGESVQKFSYLPEPYNDFIFAVMCEEMGFFGAVFIIALFVLLIWRGIKIATEATDKFASLMVVGIISQVAIQTVLNIGVATATLPNTGVSLPFFSYGGTAIFLLLAEMGIVLSVSRYSNKKV